MKTNFLKAGLAGLILSASSILPLKAQNLPLKIVDNLVVNIDTNYRTVIYKTEKEGVKDMQELVKISKVEEAWVFDKNWNIWYEVGNLSKQYEEEKESYFLYLTLDTKYIKKLTKESDNLVLYHFHPEFVPESVYSIMSKQSVDVQTSLPSINDLTAGLYFERGFHISNPKGNMSSGLVAPEGIINFHFTKAGIEKYHDWTLGGLKNMVLKPKFKWTQNFKESKESVSERVRKLTESMSDEYININFKTYKEYFLEPNK